MTKSQYAKIGILLFLSLIISAAVYSYLNDGILAHLVDSQLTAEQKREYLVEYFNGWGAFAPIAYTILVMIEVVIAPLPGAIFYAPSGMLFGWFWGGLYSVIGNTLGAGLACQISRQLGREFAEEKLAGEKFEKWVHRLEKRGFLIIILLRINPLTSSDIVSYATGITHIPTWKVMLATMIGLTPTCFVQTYFAEKLFEQFPGLIYILVPIFILVFAFAIILIVKVFHSSSNGSANSEKSSSADPPTQ